MMAHGDNVAADNQQSSNSVSENPAAAAAAKTEDTKAFNDAAELKDEEQKLKPEPEYKPAGMTDDEDDPFAAFLSDVARVPDKPVAPPVSSGLLVKESDEEKTRRLISTFEIGHVDVNWGTGMEEVNRILSLRFKVSAASYFEIFKLPPYAAEDLIKKHFRKLSILIHPDKCPHAKANDAFNLLTIAYNELLKPEQRARYTDVIEEAREIIIRARKMVNKKRKLNGQEPLPLDDEAICSDTIAKCESIIKEREDRLQYAEKTRQENAIREERLKMEAEVEEYQKELGRKRWIEQRDDRVDSWRGYREEIAAKKARLADSFLPTGGQHAKTGDATYKQSWR